MSVPVNLPMEMAESVMCKGGLSDGLYYLTGKPAESNVLFVEKIRDAVECLGFELITIEEAKKILLMHIYGHVC